MFSSLDAYGQYWESDGKTMFQMSQFVHDVKFPCHWLNLYDSEDLVGLVMFCVMMTSLSTMPCSHVLTTEDVDDIELWWQTWLPTSTSSAILPMKTALCH